VKRQHKQTEAVAREPKKLPLRERLALLEHRPWKLIRICFVRAAWLVCIALMVCAQFSSYSGCPVVVPTGFRTVSPSLSAAFGGRDFGSVRYEPGAYFCVAGVVFGKKASAALLNCMNRFRAKRGERFISLAQRESIKV
jgi:hypothetical protein